jgi:hypothetical protein
VNSVTFSGTRNGVTTPVASSLVPAGSAIIIGSDSSSKICFMNGVSARNTITTASAARTMRWRSSTRCDRKLCSWSGESGSGVLIGKVSAECADG